MPAALVLALAVACGGDRPFPPGEAPPRLPPEAWASMSPDAFCREVRRRVEYFMGREGEVAPPAQAWSAALGAIPGGWAPGRDPERGGGTAVVGGTQELRDGMNGLLGTHYRSQQHQLHLAHVTLVRRGPGLDLEPYLARRWELSEDRTALTFHLRDDVVWHDGTPVTASDVAFTFLRVSDPEVGSPRLGFWDDYLDGPAGVEVEAEDRITFRLHPGPAPLEPWVDTPILPAHLLEAVPAPALRAHAWGTRCPVGTGPFILVEHRQDDRWVFRANPAFPPGLGGRPYLDRYVYRVVPDGTTLLTELLTGRVDLYPRMTPEQADRAASEPGVEVLSTPGTSFVYVAWNTRRPQLSDPRVRRALTLAMDRPGILAGIRQGRGVLASTGVPPFHPGWVPPPPHLQLYDPEAASALLDSAGWRRPPAGGVRRDPQGRPLRITLYHDGASREQSDVGLRIQSTLAAVGVEVELRALELGALLARAESPARDFDALIMSTQPGFRLDDRPLFHSAFRDTDPYAWAGLADPRVDAVLESLAASEDPREAADLWAEYQALMLELQPYTWLYFPDWLTGVGRRLRGVAVDVRGEWAGIGEWWIDRGMP